MVDVFRKLDYSADPKVRYKDMGDGGHAEVVVTVPASAATVKTPVRSDALVSGFVLKPGAGSIWGVNLATTTVAGRFMLLDAATVPGNGPVAPLKTWQLGVRQSIDMGVDEPLSFTLGCVIVFTTDESPFVLTKSATAFIGGVVS